MIFGVDVSNHQAHFDFGAAAREGFDFAFIKCSQNDNFKDGRFDQHAAAARAAGLVVAAYHYQGTGPVVRQVETIKAMVDPGEMPVILDVEEGSGGVDITRALVAALRAEGYSVPLTYVPRWYWSGHIGSPSLAGLPPLWVSWYPDYTVRRKEQGLGMVPASVWSGYGGLDVAVVQFTSAGAVADYPGGNIDLNAFAGTREQLAALLGGAPTGDEDGSMDRIVKASNNSAVYLVRLDPKGGSARHLSEAEAAVFPDAAVVTPEVLAAFLAAARTTASDAQLVWNYEIPDGSTPLGFAPAHVLPEKIRELLGGGQAPAVDYDQLAEALVRAGFRPATPAEIVAEFKKEGN